MLGFGFRKIRPLDDETIFAHVAQITSTLSVSRQ
jgi:hypothetical protein